MELVYLGLFSRVFNWVLERIFEPVFNFVANLLNTVLSWVFREILAPILMPILESAFDFFLKLLRELLAVQFYTLFSGLLRLIDYLETAFDVFIGLKDVTYTANNGQQITGSLLEVLIQQETVTTVFWILTISGLGIAMLLTVYATAKSAFDLDFENKRPVTRVLAALMKTFIQIFTVPVLVYFIVKLAAVILKGVTAALGFGGTTSLGRILFVISSLDAAVDEKYNVSTATESMKQVLGTNKGDIVRYPFYSMSESGARDYWNVTHVIDSFDLSEFDYLLGFVAAIFLLFTLGICLLIFVQRIFELLVLYIASPYFVAMMPLDDGEKFGRWRELFIGKCFMGFGSVIGMRLFLLICPVIMGNRLQFAASSSPEMDYMMKLFFLMGGAWAVYKSGPMLTQLLSFSAGQSEMGTASMAGGFLYGHTIGKVVDLGRRAVSSPGRSSGSSAGGLGGAAGAGGLGGAAGAGGLGGAAGAGGLGGAAGAGGLAGAAARSAGSQTFQGGKKTASWTPGKVNPTQARSGREKNIRLGSARTPDTWKKGVSDAARQAGRSNITIGNSKARQKVAARLEKKHHNINLGPFYKQQYDDKGNKKVRFFGSGYTTDSMGRTTSYKMPGLSLRRNAGTGKCSVERFHLGSVVDIKTNVEGGKLRYSDISLPGFKYHHGEEGKSYHVAGIDVGKGTDGHVRNVKVGGISYQKSDTGYHVNTGLGISYTRGDSGHQVQVGSLSYTKGEGGYHVQLGSSTSVHVGKTGSGENTHKKVESIQIGRLSFGTTGEISKVSINKEQQGGKP